MSNVYEYRAVSGNCSALLDVHPTSEGFLSHGSVDILDWIIFGWGGEKLSCAL